jgi:hypothetical protein
MTQIADSVLWRGRIPGEFPTLAMGFETDDADHDMTPFFGRCLTNRANVLQAWVGTNHFQPHCFNENTNKWSKLIIPTLLPLTA